MTVPEASIGCAPIGYETDYYRDNPLPRASAAGRIQPPLNPVPLYSTFAALSRTGAVLASRVNHRGGSGVPLDDMTDHDDGVEQFCERIGPRLVGSLALFCGDRMLAEEFAQEALTRAIERWTRVSMMASPEAWTYRTAFNLARSSFRRSAVARRARGPACGVVSLPDSAESIALRDAVVALPHRQRAVIVARFYLDLDVAETARVLGCRPGTVKAHTFKAIGNLRAAGLSDDEEMIDDPSL